MPNAAMSKTQAKQLEKLLAAMAKKNGQTVESFKEDSGVNGLYTTENTFFEAQSTLNFFKARIEPRLEKGEGAAIFDKRYREWRIKVCDECEEEFAYAFAYEGVKYCSLDCLDAALKKVGLKLTVGRDLKKRWGAHYHPAIVPSSALAALKESFGESTPDAFEQV